MTLFNTATIRSLNSIAAIESGKKYSLDKEDCLIPYEGVSALGQTFEWITVASQRYYYGDSITTLIPRIEKIALGVLSEIGQGNAKLDALQSSYDDAWMLEREVSDFITLFEKSIAGLKRLQTTYGGSDTEIGKQIQSQLISRFENIKMDELDKLAGSAWETRNFHYQPASPAAFGFSQLTIELLSLGSKACATNEIKPIGNTYVLLSTPVGEWFALNKTITFGRGQFSSTHPAIRLSDQKMFACAVSTVSADHEIKEANLKELMGSVLGNTPGIVQIHAKITNGNTHYSFMDLYDRGSIKPKDLFTWDYSIKLSCMRQLISALNNLNKKGVRHADIKPENILYRNRENRFEFVLGDIGGTTFNDAPETYLIGTLLYMSPERLDVFYSDPKAPLPPGADVWALGCVFWQMLKGEDPPYMGEMLKKAAFQLAAAEAGKKAARIRLPEPSPKEQPLEHLVWEMLDPDPKTRIKPDELEKKIKILGL